MTSEEKMLLNELLESGKLTDWEQNVFAEWSAKDEKYERGYNFSAKQKACVNRAKLRVFEGKEVKGKDLLPDKYDNCEIKDTEDGFRIFVHDIQVGGQVTKKEGKTILAWLHNALSDIYENAGVEELPEQAGPSMEEQITSDTEADMMAQIQQEAEAELAQSTSNEDDNLPF